MKHYLLSYVSILCTVVVGHTLPAFAAEVVELSGEAQLIRAGTPQLMDEGIRLELGDLLMPNVDATLTVLCDNQRLWRVPSGTISGIGVGCPSRSTFRGLNSEYGPGGTDASIPYIISARKTMVSSDTPHFRWNPVGNTEMYRVQVRQGNTVIWQAVTPNAEILYDGVALQPGIEYRVTVETISDIGLGEFSDYDDGGPLIFERLEAEQVESVQAAIATIRATMEDPATQSAAQSAAQSVAIAHIYQSYQLYADAIATLETALMDGIETAEIHHKLGHLYGIVQLNHHAETHYQAAIALARGEANLDLLAHAQVGLANIKQVVGQSAERQEWLEEAIATYETLGDLTTASQLRELL
ncbi:MAG: hypothetical protein F6K16_30890 [Symploca sp. SIO2B6]|nr:hypothetical protein [Symploca sp. SIO2B6]